MPNENALNGVIQKQLSNSIQILVHRPSSLDLKTNQK